MVIILISHNYLGFKGFFSFDHMIINGQRHLNLFGNGLEYCYIHSNFIEDGGSSEEYLVLKSFSLEQLLLHNEL